jgi:hypothetical protein
VPAKALPDFHGIPANDLVSLLRFVGGVDFWPVPLRGQLPRSSNIPLASTDDLTESWNEITRTPVFTALLRITHFHKAFIAFDRQIKPNVRERIRYFHIVLNALHVYQLETTFPRFMGIGTKPQRMRAIKAAETVLQSLRSGLHLGTDRIHENQALATALAQYIYELRHVGTVRRDELLPERRFFERVAHEFLIAYKKPMSGVLLHFYVWLNPGAKDVDEDTQLRTVKHYIQNARRYLRRPLRPKVVDWFGREKWPRKFRQYFAPG